MTLKFIWKSCLAAAALVVLEIIFSSGLNEWSGLLLAFLGNTLILLLLGYYILHSSLRGIWLFASSFIIYYGIGYFNILNEAWIFNVTDRSETIDILVRGFVKVLIIIPFFVYLLNPWNSPQLELKFRKRPAISWIGRIVAGDVLYLLFYISAGMILLKVYPAFMEFYKERTMPSVNLVIGTQFFRGLVFTGIAILVLRTTDRPLTQRAVLTGLLFSVLGGIAPLIQPSEFMPHYVRMGHIFEVGISNFLYGFLLGYLLGQGTVSNENPQV